MVTSADIWRGLKGAIVGAAHGASLSLPYSVKSSYTQGDNPTNGAQCMSYNPWVIAGGAVTGAVAGAITYVNYGRDMDEALHKYKNGDATKLTVVAEVVEDNKIKATFLVGFSVASFASLVNNFVTAKAQADAAFITAVSPKDACAAYVEVFQEEGAIAQGVGFVVGAAPAAAMTGMCGPRSGG